MSRPWYAEALYYGGLAAGAGFLVFAVCFFGGLFIDVVKMVAGRR